MNCSQCEKKLTKRQKRFCSLYCRNEGYKGGPPVQPKNRVSKACAWCGIVFERAASNFHGRRFFCCYQCMGAWQSENVRGKNHPRWRGGKPEGRGQGWKKARREAIKLADSKCVRCKTFARHVHHKIPFRFFSSPSKAHAQSNLVVCCVRCHPTLEKEARKAMPLLDLIFSHQKADILVQAPA